MTFIQFNKDAPDQYPVVKIDDDHWEVKFDKIFSPGHEVGFSPNGRFCCMMNNLRENNCSVFDTSDPIRAIGKRLRMSRILCGAANIQTRSTWFSRWTAQSSIYRSFTRHPLGIGVGFAGFVAGWTLAMA